MDCGVALDKLKEEQQNMAELQSREESRVFTRALSARVRLCKMSV